MSLLIRNVRNVFRLSPAKLASLKQTNHIRTNCNILNSLPVRASRNLQSTLRSQGSLRQYSSQTPFPPPAPRTTRKSLSRKGYVYFDNPTQSPPSRMPYVLGFTAAMGGAYILMNLDRAPFTNRMRVLGMSRKTEYAMGKEAYTDLLNSVKPNILSPSHPVSRRVRGVVSRIASTVNKIDPELAQGFEWSVAVADVPEPNAMCVPGGRILITTGIMQILHTDDEMAIILAHEIAHALNRHGAENMGLQYLVYPLIIILNMVLDTRWLPTILVTLLLKLPYSRKLEHEADYVGLILCAESCYDPRVAPVVFERLAQLQGQGQETGGLQNKISSFFSTHPQTAERAERLRRALPERLERYNDKCVHSHMFSQFVGDWGGQA